MADDTTRAPKVEEVAERLGRLEQEVARLRQIIVGLAAVASTAYPGEVHIEFDEATP